MSELKELIKKHKKLEVQINKISKKRLNDRTSESWIDLRTLKKKKLILKEKIIQLKKKIYLRPIYWYTVLSLKDGNMHCQNMG